MAEVNTVRIEDGKGGYIVINESDYNEKEHKLYNDEDLENGEGRGDGSQESQSSSKKSSRKGSK